MNERILFWRIIFLLLVLTPMVISAQSSIQDLNQRLENSSNSLEKMRINYELASLNLIRQPSLATFQANKAYSFAKNLGNSHYLRKSAVLLGKSFLNQSDNKSAAKWLKTGENLAKINKDLSLLLEAASLQSGIEIRNNNYKKAYEIQLGAINFVNKNISSFQKTLPTANTKSSSSSSSAALTASKANVQKLTNENEALVINNEVLNEELLRLQYELAAKQLIADSASQDSQNTTPNVIDTNETRSVVDSLRDRMPTMSNFEKSNREKLFSWLTAILGLLSMGLLAGLYFLNRKKEDQKEMFDQSLIRKERLIKNYKEEIEEQEQIKKRSLLGVNGGAKAKKVNPLSMLIVDLGTNLEIAGDKKASEFIALYSKILVNIKAILSQYPNVFYVKKIGTTFIFGTGIDQKKHDPDQLLRAAQDIQTYIQEMPELEQAVKIGIHSGPVFLSTIDYNTESLDILGHTFDQCAWIQSIAKNGQIVVSGNTKELLSRPHHLELLDKKKDWTGQLIELYELN